jgi:hypothetical protein
MMVIIEWTKPYRNKKLLEAVRQMPCQYCGAQDGTVCAAHSNDSKHGKGMGQKASDACIAALCHRCHSMLDQGKDLSKEERREMWLHAHVNTMRWLIENEKLILA